MPRPLFRHKEMTKDASALRAGLVAFQVPAATAGLSSRYIGIRLCRGSDVPVRVQPLIEGVSLGIGAPHLVDVEVKALFLEPAIHHR